MLLDAEARSGFCNEHFVLEMKGSSSRLALANSHLTCLIIDGLRLASNDLPCARVADSVHFLGGEGALEFIRVFTECQARPQEIASTRSHFA